MTVLANNHALIMAALSNFGVFDRDVARRPGMRYLEAHSPFSGEVPEEDRKPFRPGPLAGAGYMVRRIYSRDTTADGLELIRGRMKKCSLILPVGVYHTMLNAANEVRRDVEALGGFFFPARLAASTGDFMSGGGSGGGISFTPSSVLVPAEDFALDPSLGARFVTIYGTARDNLAQYDVSDRRINVKRARHFALAEAAKIDNEERGNRAAIDSCGLNGLELWVDVFEWLALSNVVASFGHEIQNYYQFSETEASIQNRMAAVFTAVMRKVIPAQFTALQFATKWTIRAGLNNDLLWLPPGRKLTYAKPPWPAAGQGASGEPTRFPAVVHNDVPYVPGISKATARESLIRYAADVMNSLGDPFWTPERSTFWATGVRGEVVPVKLRKRYRPLRRIADEKVLSSAATLASGWYTTRAGAEVAAQRLFDPVYQHRPAHFLDPLPLVEKYSDYSLSSNSGPLDGPDAGGGAAQAVAQYVLDPVTLNVTTVAAAPPVIGFSGMVHWNAEINHWSARRVQNADLGHLVMPMVVWSYNMLAYTFTITLYQIGELAQRIMPPGALRGENGNWVSPVKVVAFFDQNAGVWRHSRREMHRCACKILSPYIWSQLNFDMYNPYSWADEKEEETDTDVSIHHVNP